jgi:dihydrofolate reductase
VLSGPLEQEIRTLKDQPGSDIVCAGSITLVQELNAAGLVDQYRLFVYPVVQGSGRRLFESETDLAVLELQETQTFTSGVVLLVYRVR